MLSIVHYPHSFFSLRHPSFAFITLLVLPYQFTAICLFVDLFVDLFGCLYVCLEREIVTRAGWDNFPPSRYYLRLPGVAQTLTGPNPFLVQFGPSSTFSLPSRTILVHLFRRHVLAILQYFIVNDQSVDCLSPTVELSLYLPMLASSLHWAVQRHKTTIEENKPKSSNKRLVDSKRVYPRCIFLLNLSSNAERTML